VIVAQLAGVLPVNMMIGAWLSNTIENSPVADQAPELLNLSTESTLQI
jgi:hypothetical protein